VGRAVEGVEGWVEVEQVEVRGMVEEGRVTEVEAWGVAGWGRVVGQEGWVRVGQVVAGQGVGSTGSLSRLLCMIHCLLMGHRRPECCLLGHQSRLWTVHNRGKQMKIKVSHGLASSQCGVLRFGSGGCRPANKVQPVLCHLPGCSCRPVWQGHC
jgi:hypothetical protein